jgi:hypothetical protein
MSSPAPWADAKGRLIAANLGVAIAWPNEPFDKPEAPAMWISVQAASAVLKPIELGAGVWVEEGTLYVDIHIPKGWGTDDARVLAKTIADTFRGLPAAPTSYVGAAISGSAVGDSGGMWESMTVSVDWRYQDINVS